MPTSQHSNNPNPKSGSDSERGGNHEQHGKGAQRNQDNDKNSMNTNQSASGSERGGNREQHGKTGQQSHKNDR